MKPRLKEDPKEWRNFALLCCAMVLVLSGIALWKKWIGPRAYGMAMSVATIAAVLAVMQPEIFRKWYRLTMTLSFHIGQVMGRVILGIFYVLVLTPLGMLLRLMRKDLLEMKYRAQTESYWKPARKRGKLEQQF